MPSNHLILCHPLLFLPSIFPSIRVFSNESALPIRWPKYWSFSFNISPTDEHPGLISFRMDWLDLLAVQGTLKSLLQHHSSKASILWHSAVFTVQLSHPYMTTRKTIVHTRWTFVDKVMSLLFNMLSRLVCLFRSLKTFCKESDSKYFRLCMLYMVSAEYIFVCVFQFSSVAQSCLTLWPHGLQHAKVSCPSPAPRAYSNSCPLSRWCHPTISSSFVPFSCLQFFAASGSFPMNQLFTSNGQSIGALASVFLMSFQSWFPLGLTGLISLLSKGPSRVYSSV